MTEDDARQEQSENKLAEKLKRGFRNELSFGAGKNQSKNGESYEFQQWNNRVEKILACGIVICFILD